MDLSWLDKINYDGECRYLFLEKTVSIQYNSTRYAFKSDGRIFIAVESEEEFPRYEEGDKQVALIMANFEATTPKTVSLSALKTWLEAPQYDAPCQECKGNGNMPPCKECGHELVCARCGGDGGVYVERRPGLLFGVAIDRNLLARALEGISAENVIVHRGKEESVQYITGPRWIVGIMPMRASSEVESSFSEVI